LTADNIEHPLLHKKALRNKSKGFFMEKEESIRTLIRNFRVNNRGIMPFGRFEKVGIVW
jgi:hypothetical protein